MIAEVGWLLLAPFAMVCWSAHLLAMVGYMLRLLWLVVAWLIGLLAYCGWLLLRMLACCGYLVVDCLMAALLCLVCACSGCLPWLLGCCFLAGLLDCDLLAQGR